MVKPLDGSKAEQSIDHSPRHARIKDGREPILLASQIGRNNAGASNSPALSKQIGNFGDG